MINWMKTGTDVVVGGAAGIGDQLVQNADDKRPEAGLMSQYGTYYNYGIPILAILGTAFNFLRGDMATRFVTAGAQLAGRKATHRFTKTPVTYRKYNRNPNPGGGGGRAPAGVGIEF